MEGFPIELARSILNMELQKDNILKKDQRTRRLCYCRKQILLNFVNICQMFFVRFASKIVDFEDHRSLEHASISDLREWYERSIYTNQFSDPNLSSKMILIFKLLQDSLDDTFFDDFEQTYTSVIEAVDQPDFRDRIQELYETINEWMENYLLNILTLKIDCLKISDDILTDFGLVDNFKCDGTGKFTGEDCTRCANDCPAILVGHDHYYFEEEIHLYMSEDFDESDFLFRYFDIITKYHTNPQNIKIIFDFVLYCDPFKLSTKQEQFIEEAKSRFKSVQIINYRSPKG